jgi:hypothetical protein
VHEPTVVKWRQQYAEAGLADLEDAPQPGSPVTVLAKQVIGEILAATVTPPDALQPAERDALVEPTAGGLAAPVPEISVSHDSVSRL